MEKKVQLQLVRTTERLPSGTGRMSKALLRSNSEKLLPEERDLIQFALDELLDSRRKLRCDLLSDPLERKTFGVTEQNAQEVLDRRLRMLESVTERISASTSSAAVRYRSQLSPSSRHVLASACRCTRACPSVCVIEGVYVLVCLRVCAR